MAAFVQFVCDACQPGGVVDVSHEGILTMQHDAVAETWGDMVAAVRAIGWSVRLDDSAHVTQALCPQHNNGL